MSTSAKCFRILLISPSGWQKESVNLGLASLAGPLVEDGFDVKVFDLDYRAQSDEDLVGRIRDFDPFIIGFSVKTATAREGARLACLAAEAVPQATLVVGGAHVTLCAKEYLTEETVFHYAVMGEAEESFLEFARTLRDRLPVTGNNGIVWRDGDEVVINAWAPPSDLSTLPYPNFDVIDGFNWDGFRYPIVTSRGCPYKCTYCCVSKLAGSIKWRRSGPAGVVGELEHVTRTRGITHFEILDDNFTLHVGRAMEICQELVERDLKLSWWCHNGIRADKITPELARLMKAAGCTSVAFGIETGNADTFLTIKKGETLQHVVDAVNMVKAAGIQAVGYFIIGLPGDTLETFIETLRFQRSLNLDHWQFGILIPYPKTEVWDLVLERGRFFCDITETQHFGGDIVPISFELPEFPREDMVRAYYVSRNFDLFEMAQSFARKAGRVTITYVTADKYIDKLAGMIIACPDGTHHRVVSDRPLSDVKALKGFSQSRRDHDITMLRKVPKAKPGTAEIFVCIGTVPLHLLASRALCHLLDPVYPQPIEPPIEPSRWDAWESALYVRHGVKLFRARLALALVMVVHYFLTALRLSIPRPIRQWLKPTWLMLTGGRPGLAALAGTIRRQMARTLVMAIHYFLVALRLSIPRPIRRWLKPTWLRLSGGMPDLAALAGMIRRRVARALVMTVHYLLVALRLSIPRPIRRRLKPTWLKLTGSAARRLEWIDGAGRAAFRRIAVARDMALGRRVRSAWIAAKVGLIHKVSGSAGMARAILKRVYRVTLHSSAAFNYTTFKVKLLVLDLMR